MKDADLRALIAHRYRATPDDPDAIAYAVKRLRAFLTGAGVSDTYIDEAATLLVDIVLGGAE